MWRSRPRVSRVPRYVLAAILPLSGGLWLASSRIQKPVEGTADGILAPLDAAGSASSRFITRAFRTAEAVLHADEEVQELEEEVAALRSQVALLHNQLQEQAQVEKGLRQFLKRRNGPASGARYLQDARVIGAPGIPGIPLAFDSSSYRHSVIVNCGDVDGVLLGAPVTAGGALAGWVRAVHRTSSRVLLLCDPSFRAAVNFVDSETTRGPEPGPVVPARGMLQGVRPGLCVIKFVPRDAEVRVGRTVVTSGLDSRFPSGLLVGKVTRVKRRELFLDVEVAPSVQIDSLQALLILRPVLAEQPPTSGRRGPENGP